MTSPAIPAATATTHRGLTSTEAEARLARFGHNTLVPESHRPSFIGWLLRPLADPMAVLLLIAAPTYFALGDYLDGAIALGALIPIAGVNLVLETRAERALDELKNLTAPTCIAWRDGAQVTIQVVALVPGDIVLLHEGDIVPADGVIVEGMQVSLDESSLTGESLPVNKAHDGGQEERALYAGTNVLSGRCLMEVTATGAATRFGQVGAFVAGIAEQTTPLQRTVRKLVLQLSTVALVACLLVAVVSLAHGDGVGDAIIAGVALAIAAIPEEFPMVFTLYLALGAWRLSREKALVRRLAGVEALGSATVICTDKTGTLTLGKLEVAELSASGREPIAVESMGEPERVLLYAALMASEPGPFDPLDQAIARLAAAHGVAQPEPLHLVRDHPFDPETRTMSHVWLEEHREHTYAKGSLEGILALCTDGDRVRDDVEALNHRMAAAGMRVIAVASGEVPHRPDGRKGDESQLAFAGLLGFSDPLRPGVSEALADCTAAGIRVVMITGDHPVTAHAVAEGLGLPHLDDEPIATGEDIDAADDAELAELMKRANIVARARPDQKHRLVQAFKADGEVVAMTGDGVNDAPALREADIGVAMGQRGTAVARESATIVLLDDNFATIVSAVRTGRRIFENLSRALHYLIAFHMPLLAAAVTLPLIGRPLLLLPVHLVLLELVLHPTVALVFEGDPEEPGAMHRPPRPRSEGLLSRGTTFRPIALGATLSAAVVALFIVALDRGLSETEARGVGFSAMLLGQLILVLVERSPSRPIWRASLRGNRWVAPILLSALAAVVAMVYVPGVNDAMAITPAPIAWWGAAIGVAAGATLWLEPFKRDSRPGR